MARCRAALATPPKGEFTFVAINDTHYLSPDCGVWLERVVGLMRAENPEFCLHVGDLVDQGSSEHHTVVREIFSKLGVPVYASGRFLKSARASGSP
jgi:predicted MPP superfamily phosphohydrolase